MPVDQTLFGNKIFAAVTKRFRRYHTGGKAQPYSNMNEGSYSKRRQVHRGNGNQGTKAAAIQEWTAPTGTWEVKFVFSGFQTP